MDKMKRQSFDGRICDDLSEVILQFLPFDDKFRLECVSQQFQRTIFEKVYRINVDNICLRVNLIQLESVLKKCPQIHSILSNRLNVSLSEQMIDLIIKYSNNLIEISSHLIKSEEISQKLVHKSIRMNTSKVSLIVSAEDTQYFEAFVKSNQKLKCLRIDMGFEVEWSEVEWYRNYQINSILNAISKLKDLNDLQIWTNNGLNESQFIKGVNKIGLNCKQLKSFGFALNNETGLSKIYKIKGFLSPFKSLKRLNIEITADNTYESFSFEIFEGFGGITHLKLKFRRHSNTSSDDIIVKNIGKYLPKLQYLDICHQFEGSSSLVYMLSGLPKLHTIKLDLLKDHYMDVECYHCSCGHIICFSIKDQIIKKCKNIRIIKFY